MSTILDALKKSEQERKLNDIPTLSDMSAPEETSNFSRVWLVSAAVMIVLMLIILGLLLSERFTRSDEVSATSGLVGSSKQVPVQAVSEADIAVNVVSWSADASQRFVMINGKLVRENEFAAPGLKVVEIKRESVIINYRGKQIERRP